MRFHRFTLATLAAASLSVGLGQVATAADMPVKAAPLPIVTAHNWTGFYIGLNAGHSWGNTTADYSQPAAPGGGFGDNQCPPGCVLPFTLNPKGFIGGGQLGYNYQTGIWVWGVEADIQWRNGENSASYAIPVFNDTVAVSSKQKWVGTVRGRLGVTSMGNWLFYATGGLAYGKFEHTVVQTIIGFPSQTTSNSPTKAGWTVGGGVEYALQRNWSLGAEYLYMDFGRDTVNTIAPIFLDAATTTFRDRSHVARVKLNYKFGP